jgi:hypothetical protein
MSVQTNRQPHPCARWGAFAFVLVAPFVSACVSRAAPFDELDDAQLTVLKLQTQQVQPTPTATATAPALIPGLPVELQQMGQQFLQGIQQMVPPGLIPPGLIPGLPATQPATKPVAPTQPLYKGQWVIAAQQPVADEQLKEDLLDIFGDPDSFQIDRGNCFYPGMSAVFSSPTRLEPVEVAVSLSCNQAAGYGFAWPHPASGFTPETAQKLTAIYQKLFGPVPPGA